MDEITDRLEGKEKTITKCYLKGKVLNIKEEYDQESLELLSKAIKLSPSNPDAWNELGDVYWKKGDIDGARNCFESALKHDPRKKESLRSLSILLRSVVSKPTVPSVTSDGGKNLMDSLARAKEAVQVDMTDGHSWSILGNAYLMLHCTSNQSNDSMNLMRQAKVAYNRAKSDQIEANQPDFLYNYANILQFEEDYQESVDILYKVSIMDKDWKEPRERRNEILAGLKEINEMVRKKASLKSKRLQSLVASLIKETIKTSELIKDPNYKCTTVRELMSKDTLISGKVISKCWMNVKVIGSVSFKKSICLTMIAIDKNEDCISLSIYNLGKEPRIGDLITIKDPAIRMVSVTSQNDTYSFPSIRIDDLNNMFINNHSIPASFVAKPIIDTNTT